MDIGDISFTFYCNLSINIQHQRFKAMVKNLMFKFVKKQVKNLSQYLVCDYCFVILHQPQLAIDGMTEILLEAVTTSTPLHLCDHAPA